MELFLLIYHQKCLQRIFNVHSQYTLIYQSVWYFIHKFDSTLQQIKVAAHKGLILQSPSAQSRDLNPINLRRKLKYSTKII